MGARAVLPSGSSRDVPLSSATCRSPAIATFAQVLRYAEAAEFLALTAACVALWWRRRGTGDRWVALAFASITAVLVVSFGLPQKLTHPLTGADPLLWAIKALLIVLLAFPYLLARFLHTIDPVPSRARRAADILVTAMAVATVALPRLLATSDHRRPWWLIAYTAVVLVEWGWLSGYSCWRLWMAGRGQPSVVRRRMHLLSLASLVLVLSLVPSLFTSSSRPDSVAHIAGMAIAVLAGALFYLGFAPPTIVRMLWRRPEQQGLRAAEARLMSGATSTAVATAVLPHLPSLFGGQGALLLSRTGEVLGAHGMTLDDAGGLAPRVMEVDREASVTLIDRTILVAPLRNGFMAVEVGPYTPFFGQEEMDLVEQLGAFVDLALGRAELFEKERAARVALEGAHNELEDLVYSLSHDLKSPLISILGYLEYLKADYGAALGETGTFYAERIAASASYMTSLIEDLLALSRVGRTETEPQPVNLGEVLADVASAARSTWPAARFDIGGLPTIRANPLRVRELFTNLVDNALKHGGREDLTVRVFSEPAGRQLAIVVADDGQGIPVQYREKVFGIFERLGGADRSAGTGIGLAMCRKIVEQMGGVIAVDPGDGPGVAFRILVPGELVERAGSHAPEPVRSPA